MKKVLIISLLMSLFALSFPIITAVSNPIRPANDTAETPSSSPSASVPPDAEYASLDAQVSVRVLCGSTVEVMTMSDYLIGVVAAEMPAMFEPEALKAQAVAARTETLYHIMSYKSVTHPDADVCSDSSDCQAYDNDSALREKWGESYTTYIKIIADAVRSTDGIYLSYGGAPIQAVFHSSSAGKTADSGEVWANSLPYLVSVESPEKAANVPNYVSSVTVSATDFKNTVADNFNNVVFGNDQNTWISDITYTDSGRIKSLKIAGVTVTGTALRSMFGLRSTAASIAYDTGNITFVTTGYGHGVGMSQYGANTMALEGKSYKEILLWYYTGVQFASEKDLTFT